MLIGYARVSTHEQNLELQLDALEKARCEKIFIDKLSSVREIRQGLEDALSHLRSGDTFLIWKLDRLGRTVKSLIEPAGSLEKQGIMIAEVTADLF